MRVLHPVTQRETLVASGAYKYTRGGQPLEGEERFSVHALPDGSWFVRVDYDWRAHDGTSQLIEALLDSQDAGGKFQRVVAQLHSPSGVAKETVDFHPAHALIGVSGADVTRRDFELPLPEGYTVLLLKTVLAGIAAARWPKPAGENVNVFAGYRSDEDRALVFESALTGRGSEDITVGGRTVSARKVELSGEFNQTLWLDSNGIALRRVTGELTAEIQNYARSMESK